MRRTFGAQQFCDRFNNCPRQFFFRRLGHALPLPASKIRFFPSPFIVSRFFVLHNRSARTPKYKSVAQRPRTCRRPFRDALTGLLQYHILQNRAVPRPENRKRTFGGVIIIIITYTQSADGKHRCCAAGQRRRQ